MKLSALLLLSVITFLSLGSFADASEIGKPAPEFSLISPDGKTYNLSDFKGKVVVLEWINYGCPFVKKFYKSGKMQELQADAIGQEVVWLSICSSAPGRQGHMDAAGWAEANKTNKYAGTSVLLDEDGKVGRQYGARTTPHMYIVDAEGNLAYNGAIDDYPSTNPKDIAKAHNYVSATLKEVLGNKPVKHSTTKPYGCTVKYAR